MVLENKRTAQRMALHGILFLVKGTPVQYRLHNGHCALKCKYTSCPTYGIGK